MTVISISLCNVVQPKQYKYNYEKTIVIALLTVYNVSVYHG